MYKIQFKPHISLIINCKPLIVPIYSFIFEAIENNHLNINDSYNLAK